MVYAGDIDSDVANMSLGAYPLPDNTDTQLLKESIERGTTYGNEQGTLYVAAAGNDGTNLDTDGDVVSLPNEAENVMSISATGPIGYRRNDPGNGRRIRNYHAAFNHLDEPTTTPAPYTNYGEEAVDLSAGGGNAVASEPEGENWQYDFVLSTVFEWGDSDMIPDYGWKAGTSMAAPQVAGTAALVKSLNPDATPGEVRNHLVATSRDLGQPTYSGDGHLDVSAAVNEDL
jgi:subtilisin family serine protease